jgi:PAS domain S-box-containing protein
MGTPGPSPTTTPEDVLDVFQRLDDPSTPLTASDVAAEVDCSRRTAFGKLETLADGGALRSKKVGARGRVWWRPTGDSVGAAGMAVVAVDASGTVVRVNDRARDLGVGADATVPSVTRGEADGPLARALRTGEVVTGERVRLPTVGGDHVRLAAAVDPHTNADGDVTRAVVRGVDVTREAARGRRLERRRDDLRAELDDVLDRVTDAFYALDEEWRFTHVNDHAEDILRRSAASLLGEHIWTAFPEAAEGVVWERFHEAMETQEAVTFELFYDPLDVWTEITAYPSETGLSVYFRDVTERKERERALEASEARYRTLAETATDPIVTIDDGGTIRFANPAVEDVFGYDPDELVGEPLATLMPDASRIRHEGVDRFLDTHDQWTDPSGVELTGVRADGRDIDLRVSFSDWTFGGDRRFTGIVRDVTEQRERERELAAQREQLATLNQLNGVVQRITHAVIESSTRDDIEAFLCERLAASDAYRFAWIGSIERAGTGLRVRAVAGVDDDFDVGTVTVDDDPTSGPLGRAIRTGEMGTARRLDERVADTDWLRHALQHGARSVAAIPIAYDDTLRGVLVLGSERPTAFDPDERAVVGQLGEIVGHALTAIERKRALTSESVVELRLRVTELFAPTVDSVRFDRAIPTGDGTFLTYGSVPEAAPATPASVAEALPHSGDVTVLDTDDGHTRFGITLSEPPTTSLVASYGGRVESATVEEGDYEMVVHLPREADVRELVRSVRTRYPDTEVVAQRRTTTTSRSVPRVEAVLDQDLTDRQQVVLEAAFFAGFFSWPRESTGEEVADALGISPPTFHQHVRVGERKLMRALFADDGGRP